MNRSARPIRRLLFVALTLAAVQSAARASSDVPLPDLIRRTTPGIVTVVSYNPDLAMPGVGTGFFVASDRVVTARHVLAGANRAVVRTSAGTSVPIAGILDEERASDLVLVKLARAVEGATALPASEKAPDVGERLFAVSSPLGLEYSASDGIVSAYREVPEAGVSMQHTVAVSAGSSGCPLLNMRGEVVAVQTGVITAGQRIVHAGQALNFAVSAKLVPALEAGELRTLEQCRGDLPADWSPPITRGIDAISLHPLTREDFRAALEFFRKATEEQPEEPDAWFRLALCHEKLDERDRAIEHYRKAIELDPKFALALNNLGSLHIRAGEYDRAIEYLRRAVEARKDYAAAFGNLAVACVQSKHWQEAADAARRAVELNGTDAEARLNLGVASVHLGHADEAARQLKELDERDKPRAERLKKVMDDAPPAGQ